jgi:2-polyprenyl-6-methoxyphenol hydroxylase-like FAD-dependent oxidoreductase
MGKPLEVVIAGAGIGGLTAAAALHREGCVVRVFERAAELKPVGAGLAIQINAMRALAHYGLAESVAQAGAPADESQLRDWRGGVLTRTSMRTFAARHGQPLIAAHRARVHAALERHLPAGALTLARAVTGYEERADGVTVTLDDGSTTTADLLVGSDGLHSKVRAQLLGDSPTRYSGYTSWRGVCPLEGLEGVGSVMSESWGPGLRFGMLPIGFGELYWFATANAPAGEADAPQPAELLSRFAAWHDPIPRVLKTTPPERILRTDIADRAPVTRWTSSRVALLGDAAHPMTPNMGQGACQAIEDAVVLAREVGAAAGDVTGALRRYEARRVPRANEVVARSRSIGAMGQWENGLARGVRNVAVKLMSGSLERGLDALYGFTP